MLQRTSGGAVRVEEVPAPAIGPTEVLVQTRFSLISPGTEGAMTQLARSSVLAKARARPDLARKVIDKARTEGISQTLNSVRSRLDDDIPLGYSASGIAVSVGEAVTDVLPGQEVATGGAGKANHAEYQAVPGMLCSPVPKGVFLGDASFATIGSIALHGLRLADVAIGARVVVVGLGLVGQLTVRLARAAGCQVAGIDLAPYPVERAAASGVLALKESGSDTTRTILEWSRSMGADAVIVTAAAKSSGVVGRTPALCRDRGTIVIVGDVGLELDRKPFYEKELSIRFARSYGPGRYETSYEDWGVDYPAGYVRWTERRNMETILDLIQSGHLEVADLVTHEFPLADAPAAYELIESKTDPYLAIRLTYDDTVAAAPEPAAKPTATPVRSATPGVGFIGAGTFTRAILIPALREAGFDRFVSVASASGRSAQHLAEREGFDRAAASNDDVLEDPAVDLAVIASPHDSHSELARRALEAGKHVFVEKPLAVTLEELEAVEEAVRRAPGLLFVGFNRRWSEPATLLRSHFGNAAGPLTLTYRVNAGPVPEGHWYNDRRQGGRLIGEVCHFIDTCSFVVGHPVADVSAMAAGRGEALLNEDLAVSVRYEDGSVAAITYSSAGFPKTEKERLEVLGRRRTGVIKDYRVVELDDKVHRLRRQDKGHVAEMHAVLAALRDGGPQPESIFETSRATLQAAGSILGA